MLLILSMTVPNPEQKCEYKTAEGLTFHLRPALTNCFLPLVFELQEIGINASFVQTTFPLAAPHAPAINAKLLEEDKRNLPLGTENSKQKEIMEMHREGA